MNRSSRAMLCAALLMSGQNLAQDDFPVLVGPYLGQTPPGVIPEVFAPNIVSTAHRDLGAYISPDMKTFYLSRKDNKAGKWWSVVFSAEGHQWRKPRVTPRSVTPFIAPDGQTMYQGSTYSKQTATGWSAPQSLGPQFADIPIMRLTAPASGTLVFDEATKSGLGTLRYSAVSNGKRTQPQAQPKHINSGKWNAHPFIATDGSYLIWDGARDGGYGGSDLYISFLNNDGSWSAALNLGDTINTAFEETGGFVSPDGKYLFFSRVLLTATQTSTGSMRNSSTT